MDWKETYLQWKNDDQLTDELRRELIELGKNPEQLEDAFYAPLEFGTAGMRGIIGPGINRMNIYTVRQATEGLAEFMEEMGSDVKQQGVAIAYDSRHKSPEFAMEAAKTLAYHGIPSYVFESLRPTPELSFAVRELHCYAGIMITASHNPSEYNGYKIYGQDGAQMPPKNAELVTTYIRKVSNPLSVRVIDEETVENSELISIIGEEIDRAYLDLIKTVTINRELVSTVGKDLKLIYTPLHGTGKMLGERALQEAGFEQFKLVPEQSVPDPDFSTVKSPNPEEKTAFEYAIRLGEKEDADILIATDPDADRLGAAVRLPDGTYEVISGNQIGALLIHYILEAHKQAGTLPDNAVVLKSIVSSELGTAICSDYGVKLVNVLTGFKFIAEKIHAYEVNNSQTFMFGFEESYGFLIKPFVRDKDAIQTLVLLAEVAAYYKQQNKTLYDALQDLFETYGYYEEKTISVTLNGIEGSQKIKKIMENCRQEAPTEFGQVLVSEVEDFKTSQKSFPDGTSEALDFEKADVLKYKLEDGTWIAIRPSGTEPKIKFYIGVVGKTQDSANKKIAKFEESIRRLVE